MQDDTFLYSEKFQLVFITFCVRDSDFLSHVREFVSPELFTNEFAQRTMRLVLDFYDENLACPDSLIFHVLDDYFTKGLISDQLHATLNAFIDELFLIPLQNRKFLLAEHAKFCKGQLFKKNLLLATSHLKKGEVENAENVMKEVFSFRVSQSDANWIYYSSDPTERLKRRNREDGERFWTLIPDLDARVQGIKAGELAIWQSQRSSGGKSAALAFLARSFAFQGKKVLIATLEMSKEDYEDRLDMCCVGLTKERLFEYDTIHNRLVKMLRFGGSIVISEFPAKFTTVSHLQRFCEVMESVENFVPDVVIVDYLDLLGAEDASSDNSYAVGDEVTQRLKGWGKIKNYAIWSGSQSGRSAIEATRAGMQHMSGSMAKVFNADVILTINRTSTEAENNQTTIGVEKNRLGEAGFTVTINTDFSRMQFFTHAGEGYET